MKRNGKSPDMRYITRLPFGEGGYQFNLSGINRYFSAGVYGSMTKALQAAKDYRAEVLANFEFTAVLGVFQAKGGDANAFIIKYADKTGTVRTMHFSAHRNGGERSARKLAIEQFIAHNGK